MKNRAIYVLSMTIIVIAAIFIVGGLLLALVPVKVIEPQRQPYKVLTPSVRAGEVVMYEVDLCKFREAPTLVVRRFVDEQGVRYALPAEESNIKAGCSKQIVRVASPSGLHTGIYYLTIDISYKVNPLRTENYHLTTDTLKVTEVDNSTGAR